MRKSGGGEAEGCQDSAFSAICLLVSLRALQILLLLAMSLVLSGMRARAELSTGKAYSVSFVDIDGNKHATADGHVTIVVLTTSADREQARTCLLYTSDAADE